MKRFFKTPYILGLIFFVVGLITLPDYNINWDASNHLIRGQAYLRYFLTGKKDYSDFPPFKTYWQKPESLFVTGDPKVRRSVFQYDDMDYNYYLKNDGDGHPPLSDILSSIFNLVLFQKTGLINDIDSYRVYGIFLASILVGLLYSWLEKVYGKLAGIVSSFSLSLYPLFWSHAHFNTEKDIPQTVFYSLFIFSVWKAVKEKGWKWIILSGLFFGLSLGTKFNILFSVFIIVPWVLILLITKKVKLGFCFRFLVAPIIAIAVFILSWPYLWPDVIANVGKVFGFYKGLGLTNDVTRLLPMFGINSYAIQTVIFITPIIILVLFILGLITAIVRTKKENDKTSLLFILWFLVPIVRVTLPGTNIHGGVRQIMEYVPAMAILAGLGATSLRKILIKLFSCCHNPRVIGLGIIFLFLPLFITLVRIHPSEEYFFNILIGGLSGAKSRNYPYWGENYGSPYRKAVEWINKNAEPKSKVVFAYELMVNIPRIFFRPDLEFSNVYRSGYLAEGEYAITLYYQGVTERSYYDMYLDGFIKPVFQTKVDGVPVIKVWKNDTSHLISNLTEKVSQDSVFEVNQSGVIIDTKEVRSLSRLEISYYENNLCKKLGSGVTYISKDKSNWIRLPGVLPDDWRISSLGEEPYKGYFIEPFVGQQVRFIKLDLLPQDTCLKNIKTLKVLYFE